MENEIYISTKLANTLDHLTEDQRERVAVIIDSLAGDGWKNSQIVAPDNSQGGGLRSFLADDLLLLFRYVPEKHAIIVASVAATAARELIPAF